MHKKIGCDKMQYVRIVYGGWLMNQIKVSLITEHDKRDIFVTPGMSLSCALKEAGILINAHCNGNGTCGGCRVKLLNGELAVTKQDETIFSPRQLEEGYRLACKAFPQTDCEIILVDTKEVQIVTESAFDESVPMTESTNEACGVAIDLGTTTIVMQLVSSVSGQIVKTVSVLNDLRMFGADVMTRMEASVSGKKEEMQTVLNHQLQKELEELHRNYKIKKIVLCANTAMIHLLMGYDCDELSKYPFVPKTTDQILTSAKEMGWIAENVPVEILPGISAFIGSDVLAGIAAIDITKESKPVLFIDLGTNGEMALFDGNENIYVTSVPAGPAFEGGNIGCGVGSVAGAIAKVDMTADGLKCDTIQNKTPVGLCGSGVLELLYELRKNEIIDENGLLSDEYFENGFWVCEDIIFTQKDIRQLQMAKSAVASAITILGKEAGIDLQNVEKIYLAGGFGYYLNVEKMSAIGMFAGLSTSCIKAVGNTALFGAKERLLERMSIDNLEKLKERTKEILLSENSLTSVTPVSDISALSMSEMLCVLSAI